MGSLEVVDAAALADSGVEVGVGVGLASTPRVGFTEDLGVTVLGVGGR